MATEIDILRDISLRLKAAEIPFMLTGSMAMIFYAEPRMTRGIDLVIQMNRKHIPALLKHLGENYFYSQESIFDAVTRSSIFNIVHSESLIKVDCILQKESLFRALEFSRRRELQIRDIRNLMATGFDQDYLQKWIGELELQNIFHLCLETESS